MTIPTLDIVIPTYNRPDLLALTLKSIHGAIKPPGLSFKVIVVDNNSAASKAQINYDLTKELADIEVIYLLETRQGRSWAINRGIEHSAADYVAFIDDDEQIQEDWLKVAIDSIFSNEIDYIVGPCKPNWEQNPPEWLPIHTGNYKGVLGWIEQSSTRQNFNDFEGTLVGGNSIVRRSMLNALGGYSTQLGRSKNNLMGGEDEELHRRLKNAKAIGVYEPALVIYHLIPMSRMTKSYHLRWAFWSGCSNGSRLNWEGDERVPKLLGLPRYRLRKAIEGLVFFLLWLPIPQKRSLGFAGIMDFSYYLGMLYGKFYFKHESQPIN